MHTLRTFLLLTLYFCVSPKSATAQVEDPFEMESLISLPGKNFVIISLNDPQRPTKLAIRYFENGESLVAEKIIDLVQQGLSAQYEGAFFWNNQLNILTSLYYPGPKRNHLLYRRLALPNLEETYSKVVDEAYTPEVYRIPFGYSISPDSSHLMFYGWTYTLPEDPAKINFRVLDRDLQEVWSQKYSLPYKNEGLYIYRGAVNDTGTAFIFCENYEGRPGRDIDERKVEHIILAANGTPDEMIKYDLNLPDFTMVGLQSKLMPDNSIVGAAFMNEGRKKKHEGLYIFRITPDGSTINRQRIPIAEDLYEAAFPYGGKESIFNANRHRFQDFFVDKIFLEDNGSWTLITEQRYERSNFAEIEFNDLCVFQLTPNLRNLKMIKRIPKRQVGWQGDWTIYSYKLMRHKGRTYLFFNDTPDNYSKSNENRTILAYNGGSTKIMMYGIDGVGNLRTYDLTPLARARGVNAIWPSRCYQNGENGVLLYGEQFGSSGAQGLLFGFPWSDLNQD